MADKRPEGSFRVAHDVACPGERGVGRLGRLRFYVRRLTGGHRRVTMGCGRSLRRMEIARGELCGEACSVGSVEKPRGCVEVFRRFCAGRSGVARVDIHEMHRRGARNLPPSSTGVASSGAACAASPRKLCTSLHEWTFSFSPMPEGTVAALSARSPRFQRT